MKEAKTAKRVLYASRWWLESMMTAVAQEASSYGWHLEFQMLDSPEHPKEWRGDGILTALSGDPAEAAAFLKRTSCPAVSLNQNVPEIDVPRVDIDMSVTGRLAADHFLERGFRHFGFYSKWSYHGQTLAYTSFNERLAEHGFEVIHLDWEKERKTSAGTWAERSKWLRQRLQKLPRPIAIFTTEDIRAVEILEACIAEDIHVPDDVAVLGFLDIPVFRKCTTIPLSSIAVDHGKQARTACALLNDMMRGAPAPKDPILIPPTGIEARQSTDTIAATTPEVRKAIRYMLDHFGKSISIDDIAATVGLCRTNLFKAFRNDLGETPSALLTRIRIEKAKHTLLYTNEKINTIAAGCGFGDRINMHRTFVKHVHTSPAAYRRGKK